MDFKVIRSVPTSVQLVVINSIPTSFEVWIHPDESRTPKFETSGAPQNGEPIRSPTWSHGRRRVLRSLGVFPRYSPWRGGLNLCFPCSLSGSSVTGWETVPVVALRSGRLEEQFGCLAARGVRTGRLIPRCESSYSVDFSDL